MINKTPDSHIFVPSPALIREWKVYSREQLYPVVFLGMFHMFGLSVGNELAYCDCNRIPTNCIGSDALQLT